MRSSTRRNRYHAEPGAAMVLFISAMLPFLFILMSLSLDLSRYMTEKELMQRKVDEAAVQAVKFLPFRNAAKEAAIFYLIQAGITDGTDVQVNITDDDMVEVRKDWQVGNLFATFFEEGKQMKAAVYARARNIPIDAIIVLDRSTYLAPQVELDGSGTPWGGIAKSARFFNDRKLNGSVAGALATQQCFNRSFSALKLTAVRLYENLSGFSLNALGAAVYPGNNMPVGILRDVQLAGRSTSPGSGEARFLYYRRRFALDDFCLAAASFEPTEHEFMFPQRNMAIEGVWKQSPRSTARVDNTNFLFNEEYAPYLSMSEALWSQAAHAETGGMDDVLKHSLQVFTAENDGSRRSLANRSIQAVVIVAGDLPWARVTASVTPGMQRFSGVNQPVKDSISTAFEEWRKLLVDNPGYSVRVFYVMPELQDIFINENEIEALENYFKDESRLDQKQDSRFQVSLIRPPAAIGQEEIALNVVNNLVLDGRASILSR